MKASVSLLSLFDEINSPSRRSEIDGFNQLGHFSVSGFAGRIVALVTLFTLFDNV